MIQYPTMPLLNLHLLVISIWLPILLMCSNCIGSSISLYFIVANNQPGYTPNYEWTYILDESSAKQSYNLEQLNFSTDSDPFLYNISMFTLEDLTNTPHNLSLVTATVNSKDHVSTLFDYAKYMCVTTVFQWPLYY